ncbi:MAG TPA: hypothetical protein VGE52_05990 [Pirellulales bacterium]
MKLPESVRKGNGVPPTRRTVPRIASLLLLAWWLGDGSAAFACPFCDGRANGVNEVGSEIFAAGFWPNLMRVALPFPVLAAVIAGLHYGFDEPGRSRAANESNAPSVEELHDDR